MHVSRRLLLISVVSLLGSAGVAIVADSGVGSRLVLAGAQASASSQAASPTATLTPPAGDAQTFSSPDLGISFTYLSHYLGDKFAAQQEGNRIYVYDTKYPAEEQQYVEVITKGQGENVVDGIMHSVLKNYDPTACPIHLGKSTVQINGTAYTMAQLTWSPDNLQPGGMVVKDGSKCPTDYTPINWIAYFLYDPTRSTKLLFFYIGQQAIPGDSTMTKGWQDTIILH